LQAEIDTGDGVWRRLDGKPTTRSLVPFLGLRKLAMEDLKASGASYLLVSAGDYGYDDFETNSSLWGIRQVGQVDGNRLYRIE
jgi:hypothetical protein